MKLTEEEKRKLLIRDISGRVMYNVVVENTEEDDPRVRFNCFFTADMLYHLIIGDEMFKIKPYLRPISDMTDEEIDKLFKILKIDEDADGGTEWIKINDIGILRLFTEQGKDFYELSDALDYLNSIHIDYNGLIEKGIAIEVTKKDNIY